MCAAGPPHPGPLVAPLPPVKKRTRPEPKRLDPFDDRPLPSVITRLEKRRQAFLLSRDGKDLEQIALEMGIARATARDLVAEATKEFTADLQAETSEEKRAKSTATLNFLKASAMHELHLYETETAEFRETSGTKGKTNSAEWGIALRDQVARLQGQIDKLHGSNAATKVEASGTALIGLADLQQIHAAMDANEAPVVVAAPELP